MSGQDPLRDLVLAFARHRITRREDRIRLCIDHAGRHLTSSADLTPAEVTALLVRLERLPAGTDLPAVVARLHAAEEQRAAAAAARSRAATRDRVLTPAEVAQRLGGVILRGGPPTKRGARAVEQFAAALAAPHLWTEEDHLVIEPPGYSGGVAELGYEGDG